MAVAYDNFGTTTAGTTTRTISAFTPVGTPRGAIVFIIQSNQTDEISGVTYGGVAMTEVTGSPNAKATGQVGTVYAYFLGASIPPGAQDIVCTASGTTGTKQPFVYSLTADADTELVDQDATINTDSAENPSITLSHGGRTCFDALSFISGQLAVSGVDVLAGWSVQNETDGGPFVYGCYKHDTPGTSDVSAGLTQTAEDALVIAVAVSEVVAGGGGSVPSRRNTLMGVGR